MILAGFTGIAFAEEWYPGIGLEKGDFFTYDACAMWDNTMCDPFEMTLLITDQTEDDWNVQMIINEDDGKTFEGHMMISKNNAYATAYDNQWSTRRYVNFYHETIAHLGVYSSAEKPSRLDQSPFGGKVWIGVTPAITKPTEEITLSFATIKTTPIRWYHQEISSTIWVSEDISFPVRGEIMVNPRNETNARYEFELKEYGTDSSLIEKPQRMNGGRISPDDTTYPVPWESRSPLKQIKNGVALFDVVCPEGKVPAYKHDRMRVACVSGDTHVQLIHRGWALLRLVMPGENLSHALCNNYDGKWHPRYDGCRGDISDLQCSLMGGQFVDNLSICVDGICPEKTYTLCVTNPNLNIKYPGETDFDVEQRCGPSDTLRGPTPTPPQCESNSVYCTYVCSDLHEWVYKDSHGRIIDEMTALGIWENEN